MTMYIVTHLGILLHAPNLLKVHNVYGAAQVKHYTRAIDAKRLRIHRTSKLHYGLEGGVGYENQRRHQDSTNILYEYLPLHRVSSYCNRQMCNHVNTCVLCLHDDS